MNPYGAVVHNLLSLAILMVFLGIFLTSIIKRQIREKLSGDPVSWELNWVHRELFPGSSLGRMRTLCLTLCLALCAVAAFFNHKNSVQNRIYFENVRKQVQINAQHIAEM